MYSQNNGVRNRQFQNIMNECDEERNILISQVRMNIFLKYVKRRKRFHNTSELSQVAHPICKTLLISIINIKKHSFLLLNYF